MDRRGEAGIGRQGGWWQAAAMLVLLATALPFVVHSAGLGWAGLTSDLTGESRLFDPSGPLANAAIFAHMLGGALITALAPVQMIGMIRRRRPALHRAAGHALFAGALATAVGGLGYIALRGTIGGPVMSLGFALYGLLVAAAAVMAVRFARSGDLARHRAWGLRLFFLALGSWFYRVQYGIWYAATGGLWSAEDFSGAFDKAMVVGFYLPWLVGLELWLRSERGRRPDARQA